MADNVMFALEASMRPRRLAVDHMELTYLLRLRGAASMRPRRLAVDHAVLGIQNRIDVNALQ